MTFVILFDFQIFFLHYWMVTMSYWLSKDVLESLSRDLVEAKRLSAVEDNEDRPYESKYEARRILSKIYEQVGWYCIYRGLKLDQIIEKNFKEGRRTRLWLCGPHLKGLGLKDRI